MQLHMFLVKNNINEYEGLEQHLTDLMGEQRMLGHEYNPLRKRLAELSEHMNQYDNYKKRKADHDQYQKDLAKQMP